MLFLIWFLMIAPASEGAPVSRPYLRGDCPVPREGLRLDQKRGRMPPTVATRVIDQGSVGDSDAAAAITGAESVWNKKRGRKAPGPMDFPEISYLSSALQTRLDLIEKHGIRLDAAPAGTSVTAEGERLLAELFPADFLGRLSLEEKKKLLSIHARSRLARPDGTVIDGLDPCEVIETLNREGYCPRERNSVEQRLNFSSRIQDDPWDLQGNLIRAIEKLYLGLQMLRELGGVREEGAESNQTLVDSWVRDLEAMVDPGRLCSSSSSYLPASAVEDFKKIASEIRHVELVRAALNALKSSDSGKMELKQFMMSALSPECDSPEERVQIEPKLKCKMTPFPKDHPIERYDETVLRERREHAEKNLRDWHAKAEKMRKEGVPLSSICGQKFYEEWGGICTPDGSLKSREEFIQEGLLSAESKLGLNASERDWGRMGGSGRNESSAVKDVAGKSESFGILSNRILNLNEVGREFDRRVISRLKSGLPMAATVCRGALEHPMIDGRDPKNPENGSGSCVEVGGGRSGMHSVVIVGARSSGRGCQYLVKDSFGKDMSYSKRCKDQGKPGKESVVSRDCEPGLIWMNSDELAVNTLNLVEID